MTVWQRRPDDKAAIRRRSGRFDEHPHTRRCQRRSLGPLVHSAAVRQARRRHRRSLTPARRHGADAVIAVTLIFSASYGGLFKTFFDILDKNTLDGKPLLIGATAGTARHSLALEYALRPLFAYLRAVVAP